MSSCDLGGSSNSTPQIAFMKIPQLNTKDSLNISYTGEAGVYRLDTVSVGDTVTFRVFLNGFSNNLILFSTNISDTTSARLLLPTKTSLDSVFNGTSSNYSTGKFIFHSETKSFYFPFRYIARKESNDVRITFTLTSDAVFDGGAFMGSNSFSFALKTPIRKIKTSLLN